MVLHVIEIDEAAGFEYGSNEEVYRVAEPRFRVAAAAGTATLPAAGWIELIRRLQPVEESA